MAQNREVSTGRSLDIFMRLIHDLQNKLPEGNLLPVPSMLHPFLVPWAQVEYRKYEFGYILLQELETRKFNIYIWRFFIEKATKFYLVCDHPIVALLLNLTGRIRCELQVLGEKILQPSKCKLLYMPVSANKAWFEPGRYECLHIELDPGYLEDIVEFYPESKELLNRLSVSDRYALGLIPANISYVMKAILKNLRTCNYTGAGLRMEMQKYIHELLSEYIHETGVVKRDLALDYVPYKDTLIKIKQWILETPHIHEQTQEKVSGKYAISLTALKLNFKALFGIPLASFVRFHALNKAHYLIATTPESIDDISEEVGYSNRTAFNQAFKKQFHYLPSRVREDIPDRDQIQQ